LALIEGCWNSSNIPKNNCRLSLSFEERFDEKDYGLCPYNPSAEQVGGLEVFLNEAAKNFELFSNMQSQNSKSKTYSG
jgi:hypothetical protein